MALRVVRSVLTIAGAGALLAATLVCAGAGPRADEPALVASALSGSDVLAGLRRIGLDPIGEPVLRGAYYVMHAYDPRGIEMRVVVDAQFGDVLSVLPARPLNAVYAPQYERAPRIIHVPPRGKQEGDAAPDEPSSPAADDGYKPAVPEKPKARKTPKSRKRAQAPVSHRAVLSAPPPAAASPAPINPAERFTAPPDSGDNSMPSPPKTTP